MNSIYLHIQSQFLLMYHSSSLQTHQSHNTGPDSSKALTTIQPVIGSVGRFTYLLRLNSQGTLVFTISERRAAAPAEPCNQCCCTLTFKSSLLFHCQVAGFCELIMLSSNDSVYVCMCLYVRSQSIDLSRCSDTDHRHLHVSSWIWTVYGWRG